MILYSVMREKLWKPSFIIYFQRVYQRNDEPRFRTKICGKLVLYW